MHQVKFNKQNTKRMAKILARWFDLKLLKKNENFFKIQKSIQELKGGHFSKQTAAQALLAIYGVDILSKRWIREAILSGAWSKSGKRIINNLLKDRDSHSYSQKKRAIDVLLEFPWRTGRYWALTFVNEFEMPPCYAGIIGGDKQESTQELSTSVDMKSLHLYQQEIKYQLMSLLSSSRNKKRAMVTLPTGAGKTRTMVETIFDWWKKTDHKGSILWLCHTDELNEQACRCVQEYWENKGEREKTIHLHRLWGKYHPEIVRDSSFYVGGIQKIHAMVKNEKSELITSLKRYVSLVIIDEAHRTVADSYKEVLSYFGITREDAKIPLIGLTATPGRSSEDGTKELVKFYHNKIIKLEGKGWGKPIERLRDEGYLAEVKHYVINSKEDFRPTIQDCQYFNTWGDISPPFLKRIGENSNRNLKIIKKIQSYVRKGQSVLVFACTVEHASLLAGFLGTENIPSAFVSSETSLGARREVVEEFRKKNIKVLCNFGIFAMGFDAPGVDVVVIARPTYSSVLYEQMIGRGMRGVKHGGNKECIVLDTKDNIENFDKPMAFERFSEYWE